MGATNTIDKRVHQWNEAVRDFQRAGLVVMDSQSAGSEHDLMIVGGKLPNTVKFRETLSEYHCELVSYQNNIVIYDCELQRLTHDGCQARSVNKPFRITASVEVAKTS